MDPRNPLRPLAGEGGGLRPGVADATIPGDGPSPHCYIEPFAILPPVQEW